MGGWTAALVCLLFLLGLEMVSRTVVADRAAGPTANQIAALDVALRQRKDPPTVLFLGGSHTQAGVAATRIEELLGGRAARPQRLPLEQGRATSGPSTAGTATLPHRERLRRGDVTYFNPNALNRFRTASPTWRRRATLADRLNPGPLRARRLRRRRNLWS